MDKPKNTLRFKVILGVLGIVLAVAGWQLWEAVSPPSPLANVPRASLTINGRTIEIAPKEIGRMQSRPLTEVNPALAKKFAEMGKSMQPVGQPMQPMRAPGSIDPKLIPRQPELSAEQRADLHRLRESPQGIRDYVGSEDNATVRMLAGNDLAGSNPANPETAQQLSARFFDTNKALLRLKDPQKELLLVKETTDTQLGTKVLRYNQQFEGYEVWPAQVVTNTSAQGYLTVVTGAYVPTPEGLDLNATVQPEVAVKSAYQHLGLAAPTKLPQPILKIYSDKGKAQELAYEVQVEGGMRDSQVFIGARSGQVLASISKICTGTPVSGTGVGLLSSTPLPLNLYQEGTSYYAFDTTKAMFNGTTTPFSGVIRVKDAAATGGFPISSSLRYGFPDKEAASALYSMGKVYDFYKSTFARESWDGSGGSLDGTVRKKNDDGSLYAGAHWFNNEMFFGSADKYAAATDVVGHEVTHGVVQASSGFVYQNQSGALNESFADLFGEGVEDFVTSGAADWKIGTNLVKPLRDMSNPAAELIVPGRPYPTRMSEFIASDDPLLANFQGRDYGGVHCNSSIPNYGYYLLVVGLPGGGVGRPKAQQIYYRALTTKLSANSSFLDLRLAAVKSAEELYGVGSTEVLKCKAAFDAVEIFEPASTVVTTPDSYTAVSGADSYVYMYPYGSIYYMARREVALDGVGQNWVSSYAVSNSTRTSMSGDGSMLVFVTSDNDLAYVNTNGTSESRLGYPGYFNSAAISPDNSKMACVMRNPTTGIIASSVYYIHDGTYEEIPLTMPAIDGISSTPFVLIDEVDFSPDGKFLAFDGYTTSVVDGVTISGWSIYVLDLKTKAVFSLIRPLTDIQFRRPSFSRVGAFRLCFEPIETNYRHIVAWDLMKGVFNEVKQVTNLGYPLYPRYSAADTRITYTGSYTYNGSNYPVQAYQKLLSDYVSPDTTQLPVAVQYDGKNGQSYRRGTYYGVPQVTVTAVNTTVKGGQTGIFRIARLSGDQAIRVPITYKTIGTARPGVHFAKLNTVVNLPAYTTSVDVPLTSLMGVGAASQTVTLSLDPQSHYTLPDNAAAATMTLTEATQTYDQWMTSMGGVVLAKGDDSDGDGFSNLFEYAVGGSPLLPGDVSQQATMVQVSSLNYLQVRVPRALVRSNILWSLERSSDMVNWTAASSVVISNTSTEITLRDSSPVTAGERRFIRVRIDEQ
ncbi:MAG: M4 family metallopeptidase [Verrucomicrobia bacterium]|nr:M4 family metallopeptidase [Verrucomicrobiota bacterium]